MSITPIEERGDGDPSEGSRRRQGVAARLLLLFDALRHALRTLVTRIRHSGIDPPERSRDGTNARSQLRVGGQGRLERRSSQTADEPAKRSGLPASANVTAELDGDHLRVYDPSADDAYIASDTWEEIER